MEYNANFLWGHDDNSVESLGYEFANAKTEEYQKECWEALKQALKISSSPVLSNSLPTVAEIERRFPSLYLQDAAESRGEQIKREQNDLRRQGAMWLLTQIKGVGNV